MTKGRRAPRYACGEMNTQGPQTPQVLFVCVHNAGRSQMAAALFNTMAGGQAAAASAGTQPADHVHDNVAAAMREVGLNVSQGKPRMLTMEMLDQADRVVTMGCGVEEACPGAMVEAEDWGLPDPKDESPEGVREIRAMVTKRVEALLREMGIEVAPLARSS